MRGANSLYFFLIAISAGDLNAPFLLCPLLFAFIGFSFALFRPHFLHTSREVDSVAALVSSGEIAAFHCAGSVEYLRVDLTLV